MREQAQRAGQPYVDHRWLGGDHVDELENTSPIYQRLRSSNSISRQYFCLPSLLNVKLLERTREMEKT
ncbi:hypothetical protein ABVN80_21410 [Acinetobacter baumannii]